MVGVAAVDDHRALRLAPERPVAADDLGGAVDRLAAPAPEEHSGILHRNECGDPLRELERRHVREVTEDVVRGERAELYRDGVCDLRSAMADIDEPQTRGRVEIGSTVLVPDGRALTAHEDELVAFDLPHRRERVPERIHVAEAIGTASVLLKQSR